MITTIGEAAPRLKVGDVVYVAHLVFRVAGEKVTVYSCYGEYDFANLEPDEEIYLPDSTEQPHPWADSEAP